MHIFIIALFLIHECRHSSGLPARPNESSPLQHLANTCENAFLADKISKKVNNCKFNGSVPNQSDLVCYMFYDINTQLCAAFQHSEFNLQGNYDTKMKERQNVATLCDSAKAWKFATMQPNSPYNVLLKVFSDPVYCQKLCGVDDFLSDDANDYCTYFMWGTEVIQSQAQTIPLQDKNLPALAAAPALNTGKSSPTAASINNTNVAVVAAKGDEKSVDTKLAKPSATAKEGTEKSEHKSPPTSTANHTGGEKTPDINSGPQVLEPSPAPIRVSSVKADPDHPAVEEEPPKKDEVENNGLALEKPKELIDVNGKPEDVNPEDDENDNDDYDQHDEVPVKIDKNDNGGVESDPEVVVKGNNNPALKIEAITLPPQRVADIMYPNGIPDSFTDDDDHFFPIFLTGIIIVVLLYILYHNKTKFIKVILGLIVEGRQSGRRRNSRGHAYRRLDTLEQAMNSSTAAPPSKIIY